MKKGGYIQENKKKKRLRETDFKEEKISEKFYIIGAPYSYEYLIISENLNILFDTGTAFWGRRIKNYLKGKNINKIDFLFFTHSHYDHVGGFPEILSEVEIGKIVAHPYFKRVLKSEKALKLINLFNIKELELFDENTKYNFKGFEISLEAEEGKILKFDNIEIKIIETPGHTRDSVSYYVLPYKIAIVGESVGVPNGEYNYILPQFLSSCEDYIKSIEKIKKLDIEILGLPHEKIIKEKENVQKFLENSIKNTFEYIEYIENKIKKHKEIKKIIDDTIKDYYEGKKLRQPIYAYIENLKAQILCLAREKNLDLTLV